MCNNYHYIPGYHDHCMMTFLTLTLVHVTLKVLFAIHRCQPLSGATVDTGPEPRLLIANQFSCHASVGRAD